MKKFFILATIFIFLAAQNLTAENSSNTEPEPYTYDEFPEFMHQLRRTEIITLGSLPFVVIGTSLVYGIVQVATGQSDTFPNPLNKNSDNGLTTEQKMQIFGISCGVSLSIGITDLVITNVKKSNKKRKEETKNSINTITVTPISEDEIIFARQKDEIPPENTDNADDDIDNNSEQEE